MKIAMVTGGGSGMGRSICLQLAQRGDAVAVVDWDGDAAESAADEIRSEGGRAVAFKTDVSDRAQVDTTVGKIRAELGPIGVLATSAGITDFTPFLEITTEAWQKMMDVNLTGTFHCVQSVIPDMIEAGWGRIILISSSSAQRGGPRMVHYASSKGGVFALTKSLALEFGPQGITVNNIAPSSIETPMHAAGRAEGRLSSVEEASARIPVRRLGTGDDIAAAAMFLRSDEASYFTGQLMGVNGGSYI
ncbi:2-hydroxycyclohexanecarboxyl-CoA dehydrogenase [Prauserella sediminis]|uniref:2-hydroxycyclohexanecarboxyl-CoA dehydrogenase n=1 Tax=Prauserella sediminis TaxID=577680 RepID=A0A839XZY4_9PSEU|nr:SDR family NAD(P)-dependent oxidoreductase [Prauserella sediminis]MBB3665606.1 2-hydroxycyclohexanecarboxyl-CoA dehydrogenase [Prauserella sediminis]